MYCLLLNVLVYTYLLGNTILGCNVYDAIIPDKCGLSITTEKLEVKLAKQRSTKWETLQNEKVNMLPVLLLLTVRK